MSLILDENEKPVVSVRKPKSERLPWRDFYGWDATIATRKVPGLLDVHGKELEEQLPYPQFYKKTFTHKPGEIVLGAPKRGGVASTWTESKNRRKARRHYQTKSIRYQVWWDRSIRRVDKVIKKKLAGMTKEQQAEFISKAMSQGTQTQNNENVS